MPRACDCDKTKCLNRVEIQFDAMRWWAHIWNAIGDSPISSWCWKNDPVWLGFYLLKHHTVLLIQSLCNPSCLRMIALFDLISTTYLLELARRKGLWCLLYPSLRENWIIPWEKARQVHTREESGAYSILGLNNCLQLWFFGNRFASLLSYISYSLCSLKLPQSAHKS